MSLGIMFGMGAASIISRNLGSGNRERAAKAVGNAFGLTVISGVLVIVVGEIFIKDILMLFGATESLFPYAYDYLSVVLLGIVSICVTMTGQYIIQSEGRAKSAMLCMVIGMGMNIILDPVFIFGFKMGIKGAALATDISLTISALYVLLFFGTKKSSIKITFRHLIPDLPVIKEIFKLGIVVFVRQAAKSILFIIMNNTLKTYGGAMAIASFGVIFRLLAFMMVPISGIGQGFQPIAGYNYGAKKYNRVNQVIKTALLTATILAICSFLLMLFFSKFMLAIFNNEQQLLDVAVPALRIIILVIPFIGLQVIGSMYFFAAGKAASAFFLSLSRQIIFLIPLVLIFSYFWGVTGVWAAFPAADFFSSSITGLWLLFILKHEGIIGKKRILSPSGI
jgi:putative MATE family efflux protein